MSMKTKDYNKKMKNMFPEYKELIQELRQENPHFAQIFESHEHIDREISRLEQNPINYIYNEIENLKRKKLKLKDEIYELLRRAISGSNNAFS